MAHIVLTMQALGVEHCTPCGRAFGRAETMSAIEYEDGEPAGWCCTDCITYWKEHGEPPVRAEGE